METDDGPKEIIEPLTTDCFYLSKVFQAHANDVKCVIGTSTGSIISGSRDGSIKLWTER